MHRSVIVTLCSESGALAVVTMTDTGQTDQQASECALSCIAVGSRGRGWRAVHVLRCDVVLNAENSERVVESEPLDHGPSDAPLEASASAPSENVYCDIMPEPPEPLPGPKIISKGTVADLILLRKQNRCGSLGHALLAAAKEGVRV